ncbi:MAG: methyltransferase domain-containing protein [Pirellulales bacterium]|nr:methyltransferase domain-containing protein [Pirellulales bacterium]
MQPRTKRHLMKGGNGVGLAQVQGVYSGPEFHLWELVMGRQIHIGGMQSSIRLADRAGIGPGMKGVDLCCCTGEGMRFLVRDRNVERMQGVDATEAVVEIGRERCRQEGLAARIEFTVGDACRTGLPDAAADFVWGEDAWCYVVDKPALIAEAIRLVKPGGMVAFTDWVEGPAGLAPEESLRLLAFMKFPNVQDLDGYAALLLDGGCEALAHEDTGQFAPHVDLYLNMLGMQFTYDALRIVGFDRALFQGLAGEMTFMQQLAHAGKIAQGLFVARKKAVGRQ